MHVSGAVDEKNNRSERELVKRWAGLATKPEQISIGRYYEDCALTRDDGLAGPVTKSAVVARASKTSGVVRQSEVLSLFTNESSLNYRNPLVGHIWKRCDQALRTASPDLGT
jgi:hypothetical protein